MAKPRKLTPERIEKIKWAYEECLKDPGILAGCVADKLGETPRNVTSELVKLVELEVFTVEKQGNSYLFRLNPDSPDIEKLNL